MTTQTKDQKHTPGRAWRRDHASIIGANGNVIALVTSTDEIGDLIVTACNNHDRLLESLEAVVFCAGPGVEKTVQINISQDRMNKIKSAIALATNNTPAAPSAQR